MIFLVHLQDQVSDGIAQLNPCVASHQGFNFGQDFNSGINLGARNNAQALLHFVVHSVAASLFELIQPAKYFSLKHQHGFQHFLCVVFSHVVFLLWVGGVATATLAGGGVAFYFVGAV